MAAGSAKSTRGSLRLDLLIDALSDYAIAMLDADGFVTAWNAGAEQIKGYRSGEIISQHFSRFFTTEDRAARVPEMMLAAARTAGRFEAEGWRVRKDGTRFWANAVLQVVQDEAGDMVGFANITQDMTDRIAAQNALAESERHFRILVDGVVDYALYMLDPSGTVVSWNIGAERLKGYSASEIVGQHFSKFYTREDREKGLPGRILEIAAREGRYEAEGWRVRKDGSRFWASTAIEAIRNDKGKVQGFAKVTRDISERDAAQDALRQSERQFRLLVTSVTDYALYMLDPDGIITSWNAGAQNIKGYTAEEVIGQHFSRFYPEKERAAGVPARALRTAATEGRFEAEGWRVRKDGSMFWASVVIDPVRDERGNLIGFAKIIRDITERREAQMSLKEAEAQRAQLQKMDALGQLTGGVAHDFNNLLMVVSGHVRTLKKAVGDNPKLVRAIEAIEIASQRGASLTRQLLTFSRRQAIEPAVLNVGDQIEACRTLLTSCLGAGIKLVTTVEPQLWPTKVDPNELELALVNIAVNARDAMPGGGHLTILAQNRVLTPANDATGLEGEFVALRITNSGAGIPPDVLPRVFDPFFTTKGTDKGSGLGLSQVHGFAHQSGGAVGIESKLGQGTTVTLYFPRTLETPGQAVATSGKLETSDGMVLVVEDNPDVAEVTASMLEQLGYRVHAVSGADAARAALAGRDFDLVLSDIVMAGTMNGIGLARALRESHPDLPVLLVTGYSEAAAKASGEFTLIRKPFELEDLSRTVARVIAAAKQPPTANVVRLPRARQGLPPPGERN